MTAERLEVTHLTKEEEEVLVEDMAEAAHNAWWRHYVSLGIASRKADWGEEFMVPFSDLSERGKDLDRAIMRGILRTSKVKGFVTSTHEARLLSLQLSEEEAKEVRNLVWSLRLEKAEKDS